jgi:hypothetical protein
MNDFSSAFFRLFCFLFHGVTFILHSAHPKCAFFRFMVFATSCINNELRLSANLLQWPLSEVSWYAGSEKHLRQYTILGASSFTTVLLPGFRRTFFVADPYWSRGLMFNNSMQIREVQAQNNRYWWAEHLLKVGVAYDSPGFFFVLFYTGMTSYSSCWMQTKRGLNRVWLIFSECATKTILILTAMSLMGRTLIRHHVGALPLIHRIAERMGLRALFDGAIQSHGNDQVPVVDTLILLIYNLTLGKEPLYELPEWVGSIDRRVIGYQAGSGARAIYR